MSQLPAIVKVSV